MNLKKIAVIALLVAVISAAAAFTVTRIHSEPTFYVDQKVQKIDVKSFELFSETKADWAGKYAPDASGRFKNPDTGEYTMVRPMKCASCGRLIPAPNIPGEPPTKPDPGKQLTREDVLLARAAAVEEVLTNYKCPRCGKNAWVLTPPKTQ